MNITITTKNFSASDHLRDTIEGKLSRLGKYFSGDIETVVTVSKEKGRQKIEATINAGGAIFRAEETTQETTQDIYTGIDRIADKLGGQMSKFKRKIKDRHKDNKSIRFDDIPDLPGSDSGASAGFEIARRKTHELLPMSPEEAILQMELLSHSFYVFLDMDREQASVVYKRSDGRYGLLETTR